MGMISFREKDDVEKDKQVQGEQGVSKDESSTTKKSVKTKKS
jgi:hypothetical protein